jgi:hypothetical protein
MQHSPATLWCCWQHVWDPPGPVACGALQLRCEVLHLQTLTNGLGVAVRQTANATNC